MAVLLPLDGIVMTEETKRVAAGPQQFAMGGAVRIVAAGTIVAGRGMHTLFAGSNGIVAAVTEGGNVYSGEGIFTGMFFAGLHMAEVALPNLHRTMHRGALIEAGMTNKAGSGRRPGDTGTEQHGSQDNHQRITDGHIPSSGNGRGGNHRPSITAQSGRAGEKTA